MNFDRIIVVTTRELEYRKEEKNLKVLAFKYRKYPNLLNTMNNRGKNYNKTLEELIELEKTNKIFVIRPSKKIPIKRAEKNPDIIQQQYDLGVNDFKDIYNDLKEYLR